MVKPKTINSVLIANRGEIAVRIIKTLREMGLRSIAVYSDADKNALHVSEADDAVEIGPGPATQSYLSIENVIKAAKKSGADAIHPGYGFLSENPKFAKACADADIIFIGPSIEAIEVMGNKARAKQSMAECGVPCVAGYAGDDQSEDVFIAAANDFGFPVMIKAAAGGGGRGMRLVERAEGFAAALHQARGEALSGFGSQELILEKAITNARHIEFQIFGDSHGNIIHLGERDCSLQRRHQKVIEEAPSPAVDDALRKRMGEAAVKAAHSVSYEGAGTVEFLLDENREFYFLEMNTRLQVEHPVSEMVTGLDLVEWQIRVARGEALPLRQDEVNISGHAIEARIYAEAPANNFAPSTGRIELWMNLDNGAVRTDSGVVTGSFVSPYYDAMLAKIITHAPSREEARTDLIDALHANRLYGPEHNKEFLCLLLECPEFIEGNATTELIESELAGGKLQILPPSPEAICTVAISDFIERRTANQPALSSYPSNLQNWSSSPLPGYQLKYGCAGEVFEPFVEVSGSNRFRVLLGNSNYDCKCNFDEGFERLMTVNGQKFEYGFVHRSEENFFISIEGRDYKFSDMSVFKPDANEDAANGMVRAPMHGVLVEIAAKLGEHVTANTSLATLEAMKMRHEIFAGVCGVVKSVPFSEGAQVSAGDLLIEIDRESLENATGD